MNRPTRRFMLKLCKLLGKTQWELIHGPGRLSVEDIVEWMTEYQIEPFEYEDDIRFATLSAMIAKSFLQSDATDLFNTFLPKRSQKDRFGEEQAVEQTAEATAGMLECAGFTVIRGVRPQ